MTKGTDMWAVQQIVFLILSSVSVTCVTDPELIRPYIPVMTHSLDQKVMARKVKARFTSKVYRKRPSLLIKRTNSSWRKKIKLVIVLAKASFYLAQILGNIQAK